MKRFGWMAGIAMLLVMAHGGWRPAAAQGNRAEEFLSKLTSVVTVPQRHTPATLTLNTYAREKQSKIVQLINSDFVEKKTAFWTDSTVLFASAKHGRFMIEGLERNFSGKALAHPAEATVTRDALRTEIGTSSMKGAPTFYGVKLTLALGHRR